MSITLVQSGSNTSTGGVTVTLGANTTAGNCLVALISGTNGTVSGVKLGGAAGNWALQASNTTACDVEIWADPNCAGGQTSVAVTSSTGGGITCQVYEFSGVVLASPLDKTANNSASSTSWTSTATATTTLASEAWVGVVGTADSGLTLSGPASPWNNSSSLTATSKGGNVQSLSGYQITSSTGAATYAGTGTSAGFPYGAVVVTLKGAATAPSSAPANPGRTWRRRFNVPEHEARPGNQSVANPGPPTSGMPTYYPRLASPGPVWRRRFNIPEHLTQPSQQAIPPPGPPVSGTPTYYAQPANPGHTWRRRFQLPRHQQPPGLQTSPTATGGSHLKLTTSAGAVLGAGGASALKLTTAGTPTVIVPGSGASILKLTTAGAAAVAGAGTSILELTSHGSAEVTGAGGSRLHLTSTGTPSLFTKTLIVSIAAEAGTDQYGNHYVQGLGVYGFGQLVSPEVSIVSDVGGLFVEAS